MATLLASFDQLSDQDLLREVTCLAAREREATAGLVASLAALDRRRLYLAEGYRSLFVYCTQALGLSESATYKRITAARAAQRFPMILERLAAGDVTLTTIRLLAPHLTQANHVALLAEVRHCSTREVEQVVARLQPRPAVPSAVRKLPTLAVSSSTAQPPRESAMPDQAGVAPEPAAADDEAPPSCSPAVTDPAEARHEPGRALPPDRTRATVTPLAPARYKVSFTIGAETYAKLREAQDLLRHVIPNGDVAALFDRGLTLLLLEAAKTKRAATGRPRVSGSSTLRQEQSCPEPSRAATARSAAPGLRRAGGGASATPKAGSRHIPADVKRRVWARDGGQCAFVSASGHRCTERGFLEYHHRVPYAAGGDASVENISLRCRRHNAHEAEPVFGPWRGTAVRERRPRAGPEVVAASGTRSRILVRPVFAARDADRPGSLDERLQSAPPLHHRPATGPRTPQLAARPVGGPRHDAVPVGTIVGSVIPEPLPAWRGGPITCRRQRAAMKPVA
ncbi:MAG: hypothetical protein GEU99_14315 [Luteitalea sp.]|nr:hypothetical protein [Luteitalea sp.]